MTDQLRTWRQACTPHRDIREDAVSEALFAVNLSRAIADEGAEEYRDPTLFFERTHLTRTLKSLIRDVLNTLWGENANAASTSVIHLQTTYAGGDKEPKGLPFDVEPEIEPEPGAWRGQVSGSGALAQGDGATALGERAVQAEGDVGGDVVTGDKTTAFDPRGQTMHGTQTNIQGDVSGPVLSGQFNGPVATGNGEAVDMRGSHGGVYKPGGPVKQHWGDNIRIRGDGNVVGDHNRVNVNKSQTTGVTVEAFRRLLREIQSVVHSSSLDPETQEMVENDLEAVETQASREQPNRMVIFGKLNSVLSMLATADGVLGLAEQARPLAERALQWAQTLF